MQRVFVTGATGFVGRAVVQALRADGHSVRCLVRRGSERDLRGLGAIERVEGDVLVRQGLEEGMAGCQAVIHLVGIIHEYPARGVTFEQVHTQGTINVLDAATDAGVKQFLHMSALGTRPGARRGITRRSGRPRKRCGPAGLRWTIFRPSIIYGRGDQFITMLAYFVGATRSCR